MEDEHDLDFLQHEVWWFCMCGESGGPYDSEADAEQGHDEHHLTECDDEEKADAR